MWKIWNSFWEFGDKKSQKKYTYYSNFEKKICPKEKKEKDVLFFNLLDFTKNAKKCKKKNP